MNALLVLIYLFWNQTPEVYNVNLTINNVKELKGDLVIAVFDNEENFMQKEVFIEYLPVNESDGTVFTKLSLPQGTYSIAVFHDLNGNKELDKNYIGIPKESFGFSNKSLGIFGPPSFDDTKFAVPQENSSIIVKLITL